MTFQQRLKRVMNLGNLTVADLARWFERPDPTVRCWVESGAEPGGGPQDVAHVMTNLIQIEKLVITNKSGLPVPRLSPSERILYLRGIKQNEARK